MRLQQFSGRRYPSASRFSRAAYLLRSVRLCACLLLAIAGSVASVSGQTFELVPDGRGLSDTPADILTPRTSFLAVTFGHDGSTYLLDDERQRVIQVDEEGRYRGQAGGFGFGSDAFRQATDLATGAFELWISDMQGGRIVRFDPWLAPLDPFSGSPEDDVELQRPVSTARLPNGDVLVLEQDLLEILRLDSEGRMMERIARRGDVPGGLVRPTRIEASSDGRIAVVDPGRREIVLLDRFGTFTGRRVWPFEDGGPTGAAWSDSLLWVCGEGGVAVWGEREQPLQTWPSGRFDGAVRDLDRQGNRLVTVGGSRVRWFLVRRAK
ncbi:hypothetical protein GF324_04975 [bacterium]|nr:hypothetical protein [bacterium]